MYLYYSVTGTLVMASKTRSVYALAMSFHEEFVNDSEDD